MAVALAVRSWIFVHRIGGVLGPVRRGILKPFHRGFWNPFIAFFDENTVIYIPVCMCLLEFLRVFASCRPLKLRGKLNNARVSQAQHQRRSSTLQYFRSTNA